VLEGQREKALQESVLELERESWVSGRAQLGNARRAGPLEVMPVQVRLKPAWDDPYQDRKWPLQIKIEESGEGTDGATLLGMHAFSAQSPATYGYLNRWLYLEGLRRVGILAPRTHFVRILLNGEDWGLYTLQEAISAEMLESQRRADSTIVRVDQSLFGTRRSLSEGSSQTLDRAAATAAPGFALPADAGVGEFGTPQGRLDPAWQEQRSAALGLLQGYYSGRLRAAQVFDPEQIGRYIAHANLWGARDGLLWRQEWYAYNSRTMRLEPIAHDAFSGTPADVRGYGLADLAGYDDLDVMEAYAREVVRITQPEYLEELESEYAHELEGYYLAFAQEFASMDLELPWDRLPERQEGMRASLHPSQPAYAYQVTGRLDDTVHVEICNLLWYPLAVDVIQVGGIDVDVRADWTVEEDRSLVHQDARPELVLRGLQGNVPEYVTLRIPAAIFDALAQQESSSPAPSVKLVTHVIGMHDQIAIEVHRDNSSTLDQTGLPVQPSLEQAIERYPFLSADPSSTSEEMGWLRVRAGTWQVDGDLILPDGFGLRATRPVTLAFDRGAILYASGPLSFDGPEEGGIRLVPKDDLWGGILVVRAGPGERSYLHNVEISGTSGIQRRGLRTRGGITFYESPVTFNRCRLRDTHAETAVHVVHSQFELRLTQFENTAANAFDADLAWGSIE
jgi:hypothetical protein